MSYFYLFVHHVELERIFFLISVHFQQSHHSGFIMAPVTVSFVETESVLGLNTGFGTVHLHWLCTQNK